MGASSGATTADAAACRSCQSKRPRGDPRTCRARLIALPNPRECPECGGPNIQAVARRRARPRQAGILLLRRRRCRDCGYEGDTAEFWIDGERAVSMVEEMLGKTDVA